MGNARPKSAGKNRVDGSRRQARNERHSPIPTRAAGRNTSKRKVVCFFLFCFFIGGMDFCEIVSGGRNPYRA